jgi:hypothetical protein
VALRVVSMDVLKLELLQEPERTGDSVAEVYRRRGIARASFYRYGRRYLEEGVGFVNSVVADLQGNRGAARRPDWRTESAAARPATGRSSLLPDRLARHKTHRNGLHPRRPRLISSRRSPGPSLSDARQFRLRRKLRPRRYGNRGGDDLPASRMERGRVPPKRSPPSLHRASHCGLTADNSANTLRCSDQVLRLIAG